MALSLAEYLRSQQLMTPTKAGVIKVFIKNAPILGDSQNIGAALPALRWENTVGGVVSFTRQKTLPDVAFRALNSEYNAVEGETETITENMKLIGTRIEVDRALLPRGNRAGIATQQEMQVAALARKWNETFYKGDGSSNSFTGLEARLTTANENLIDNGGGGIDLYKLDKILLNMRGTDRVLAMGSATAARLGQKATSQSNVNYTPPIWGQAPATYNGVPILLAGEKADESEILDFSETGDTTSIYVLSLETGRGVVGSQTQPLQVISYDENKVDSSYLVEWDNNFVINTKRSAYRLSNIADDEVGADYVS